MKIRIMGTKAECELVIAFYKQYVAENKVYSYSISELYPNRGNINLY